ncbi:hypothetical protein ACFOQM_09660 [Paenibacillus sp. GCM10012307]|uniref:Uncharacterized protein n=1 Tax=Paenibacillus roseus TaxID=2798579 RepID=A0A934J6A7_9BACL|nr:hypothetical protein [Paenibacillus roseus]MBJ6361551.1 hypothetical protein [Paenibacillus roseus]
MKKQLKVLVYLVLCILYAFSADIFASFEETWFLNKGQISNGLRLPVMSGAFVIFILILAGAFGLTSRMPLIVAGVIGAGTLGFMVFGFAPIGTSINAFQILWFGASTINLAVITILLFLASIGIIKEHHLEGW